MTGTRTVTTVDKEQYTTVQTQVVTYTYDATDTTPAATAVIEDGLAIVRIEDDDTTRPLGIPLKDAQFVASIVADLVTEAASQAAGAAAPADPAAAPADPTAAAPANGGATS